MRDLVIKWNNMFPLDNWFRRKYNIPFNSKEHRESNQIDILFEYIEYIEYKKIMKNPIKSKKEEKEDELFDSIDFSQFENNEM